MYDHILKYELERVRGILEEWAKAHQGPTPAICHSLAQDCKKELECYERATRRAALKAQWESGVINDVEYYEALSKYYVEIK